MTPPGPDPGRVGRQLAKRRRFRQKAAMESRATRTACPNPAPRAARAARRTASLVEMWAQGRDHPAFLPISEAAYLKCAIIAVEPTAPVGSYACVGVGGGQRLICALGGTLAQEGMI